MLLTFLSFLVASAGLKITRQFGPMQTVETLPNAVPTEGVEQPPRRLLLVEYHDDAARAISRLLRFAGFRVTTAFVIASALEAAKRSCFVMPSKVLFSGGRRCRSFEAEIEVYAGWGNTDRIAVVGLPGTAVKEST